MQLISSVVRIVYDNLSFVMKIAIRNLKLLSIMPSGFLFS